MKEYFGKFKLLFYNPIIVYLILMILIGFIAINSAIPLTKVNYPKLLNPNFGIKQLLFIGIGVFIIIAILMIGSDRIRALRWWIYGFWMLPLIGLFIHQYLFEIPFAIDRNGAYSWYEFGGNTIQPSEFMKIGLVLVVADIIQRHNEYYPHLSRTYKTDFYLLVKIMMVVLPPFSVNLFTTRFWNNDDYSIFYCTDDFCIRNSMALYFNHRRN